MQRCSIMTFIVRKGLEIFERTRLITHGCPKARGPLPTSLPPTILRAIFHSLPRNYCTALMPQREERSLVDPLWLRIIAFQSITRPLWDSWAIVNERTVASPRRPALSRITINGARNTRLFGDPQPRGGPWYPRYASTHRSASRMSSPRTRPVRQGVVVRRLPSHKRRPSVAARLWPLSGFRLFFDL